MAKKLTRLNAEILAAAIDGFEAQKQRLDAQIAELRRMMGGSSIKPGAIRQRAKAKKGGKPHRYIVAYRKGAAGAAAVKRVAAAVGGDLRPATPFDPAPRPRPKPDRS